MKNCLANWSLKTHIPKWEKISKFFLGLEKIPNSHKRKIQFEGGFNESTIYLLSEEGIGFLIYAWIRGKTILEWIGCTRFFTENSKHPALKDRIDMHLIAVNRQQPSPLLYSIGIWPARNSRLTQRETNHYITRCASELAWLYLAGSSPGQLIIELFSQHQRLSACCQ